MAGITTTAAAGDGRGESSIAAAATTTAGRTGGGGSRSSSVTRRSSVIGTAATTGASRSSSTTSHHYHHYHHHALSVGSSSVTTSTTMMKQPSRPPVLLEFTETVLKFGIVGALDASGCCPKDIVPLNRFVVSSSSPSSSSSTKTTTRTTQRQLPSFQDSAAVWYRFLSPLLKYAYQQMGLLVGSVGRKDRNVFVIFQAGASFDDSTLPPCVHDALLAVLLGNLGAPAVSFHCCNGSMMIPYGFPSLSHMLVVYLGLQEASCFVHAAGENLRFTYQTISLEETRRQQRLLSSLEDGPKLIQPTRTEAETPSTITTTASSPGPSVLDQALYLDLNNPNSLLVAILKALEACPRSERKAVIANLVFAGTGLLSSQQSQIPIVVTKQLKAVLAASAAERSARASRRRRKANNDTTTTTVSTNKGEEEDDDDPAAGVSSSEESPTTATRGGGGESTIIPILPLEALAGGLEAHVGLIQPVVHPNMLVWFGTSQWAMHWYGKDPQFQALSSSLQWKTKWPPSSSVTTPQ